MLTSPSALTQWLSSRATGFEHLKLTPRLEVATTRPFAAGDTLFELSHRALLTPREAYEDREVGRDLQAYGTRFGSGFNCVALASFIALERVRAFRAATWFAGSSAATRASEWSPVTSNHWLLARRDARISDPSLRQAIVQGTNLVLPHVELAARRAASTDGEDESWSRGAVVEVLEDAFALVLDRQFARPPPVLRGGGTAGTAAAASGEQALLTYDGRGGEDDDDWPWGFEADVPSGPALLPPLAGVLLRRSGGVGDGDTPDEQGGGDGEAPATANAEIGLPPQPRAGSLGAGVGLRCVASRDLAEGELLRVEDFL